MLKVTHKIGKPKLKGKAKVFDIVNNSDMEVAKLNDGKLLITITGEAAIIPSMKNSKLPKSNFSNPNFMLRVKALDILFNRASQIKNFFGTQLVHLLVVNAKRNRQYDPIGTLETIQDWLEPETKSVGRAKRPRGWGVGLIENDSQIIGLSLKGDTEKTMILIQPYTNVESFVVDFILKLKGANK